MAKQLSTAVSTVQIDALAALADQLIALTTRSADSSYANVQDLCLAVLPRGTGRDADHGRMSNC